MRITFLRLAALLLLLALLSGCSASQAVPPATAISEPAPTRSNGLGRPLVQAAGQTPFTPPVPDETRLLPDNQLTHPVQTRGAPNPDAARLVESLEQQGFELQFTGNDPPTALLEPAPGVAYRVGEGWLHVHWYPDEQIATYRSEAISSDARWPVIDWVADPHFYRCGAAIALYLGHEASLLATLQDQCGAPFAPPERSSNPPTPPVEPTASEVSLPTQRENQL